MYEYVDILYVVQLITYALQSPFLFLLINDNSVVWTKLMLDTLAATG